MNQYYLPWRAGALYRAAHVRDGAQLIELTRVACKLKLTFAPLVVMIRQVHGTFPASTNSTPTWFSENNPSTDGGRVPTTCGRNPGFQAERGFLVRLIPFKRLCSHHKHNIARVLHRFKTWQTSFNIGFNERR